MTPNLQALAMLNNMFESFDGRPVDQALITRKDYAFLVQVLTSRERYVAPEVERTKVFTVESCYPYEGCRVVGTLPTREAAEKAIAAMKEEGRGCDWEIKEWTLGEYAYFPERDKPLPQRERS